MVNRQLAGVTGRWPEIDGLRAVAIVPVLLFHLDLPGFGLGWAGVNLFFVISGFLITGILMDCRGTPDYFRNFYIRRSLRIFPIYYLTLVAIFAWALLRGGDVSDAGYYAFYVQNFPLGAGNWSSEFPRFFTHTWSLAIEEQFYWLWPLLVWRATPRVLACALALFFGAAIAWRFYAQLALPGTAWFATTLLSQLDGLSAGAALALLIRSGVPASRLHGLAIASFGASALALAWLIWLIGYGRFWRPEMWVGATASPLVYSALAVLFAAILLLAILHLPGLAVTLRLRPLRHIGIISYGLYVYHYPAFAVVDSLANRFQVEQDALALDIAKLTGTYLIALTSWHLLERPLLALKERWAKRETDLIAEGSR